MTLKNGFGKCSLFVLLASGWKIKTWPLRFPAKKNPNKEDWGQHGERIMFVRNVERNVEQEALIAIFHLYTPLMSSKRKGRSSAASQSSNQSPEEKRSKNSETDEVFEALQMVEDVGLKLQRVLDKLEKLDKIEANV